MSVINKTDVLLDELMYCDFRTDAGVDKAKSLVRLSLKNQDRDTRHACAEALLKITLCRASNDNAIYNKTGDIVDSIPVDEAHSACMNVNAL